MAEREAHARQLPRPGGRAARIQAAVYAAVETLQAELGVDGLSVHAIARQAAVNPTTIYRRWGSLSQLLSDIALQNLLPDSEPEDTGSMREDFNRWLEEYVDELATETGRKLLRDIASAESDEYRQRCQQRHYDQIAMMRQRAIKRGEAPPEIDDVMDQVVAPVIYRIMFATDLPDMSFARTLMAKLF